MYKFSTLFRQPQNPAYSINFLLTRSNSKKKKKKVYNFRAISYQRSKKILLDIDFVRIFFSQRPEFQKMVNLHDSNVYKNVHLLCTCNNNCHGCDPI